MLCLRNVVGPPKSLTVQGNNGNGHDSSLPSFPAVEYRCSAELGDMCQVVPSYAERASDDDIRLNLPNARPRTAVLLCGKQQ
ncbi:hypothetical protein PHSY_007379 [Pseudozyma hubeiensis SY62]|uniref:Uncharacterized protein n=1 Tax=Pseudozyma hubeiensis (strain SY62) TaxID=1305764 RepID=R9PEJ7_PSEHS|nr:hypothetical protein PHSY_007379 [Pseudozyma hubeiensis SY62]GAC99776.1 hypothetical protein PHSY_007379 [Pseudozyma hubeiensis SY62]